jgi:MOSC domain-containing protein
MMRVAELWRYPVKSLAGERLERVDVTVNGIAGDRVVHVIDGRGRVVTARTHPRLLGLAAVLDPDGEPRIAGSPWTSQASAAAIQGAAGADARLVRYDGRERFDVMPLLIATDGAISTPAPSTSRYASPKLRISSTQPFGKARLRRCELGPSYAHR